MRQIGSIDSDRDAERFSDYLLTQGIGNMVEEQGPGGAWAIWIEDDDHLDRGRVELEQFRANSGDPKYEVSSHAEKIRQHAEQSQQRRHRQFVDVRTQWANPKNLARPVTILLVAISIVVSVGMKLGMRGQTPVENALRFAPAEFDENGKPLNVDDGAILRGQVWRLVTPIFIHFGPLHLIFNMFWLLDLGAMIETRRGSVFLLLLVLVTAAVSNTAQYFLGHWGVPNPFFGGMSGVVYALFGYVWIKGKFEPHVGVGVSQQTVTIMLVWLVICMTGKIGPVANVAHVVGLLGGICFAYVPYLLRRMARGR